jgi:uncharacterized membrane protein
LISILGLFIKTLISKSILFLFTAFFLSNCAEPKKKKKKKKRQKKKEKRKKKKKTTADLTTQDKSIKKMVLI